MEASLPKLINSDQTGFIKACYIEENIRLIIDIMEYTKAHNIPGILQPRSQDLYPGLAPSQSKGPGNEVGHSSVSRLQKSF